MWDGQRLQPEVRGRRSGAVYLQEQNQMLQISELLPAANAALPDTGCSSVTRNTWNTHLSCLFQNTF